jgi:glycosyltransferase involved in cell wall biosynthesis
VNESGAKPRVFVLLERGLSLDAWQRPAAGSSVNSPTPYGYGAAAGVVDLTWSTDGEEMRAGGLLRHVLRKALGFDLVHAARNRRALRAADVVWTHTERESMAAVAMLRLMRHRSTKVIAQTIWLWDEWPSLSRARRAFYRMLLGGAAVEVTLSIRNRDVARVERRTPRVYCVPFGAAINREVAAAARSKPAAGRAEVLAVGSDRHRDWRTLHEAARLLPDVRFRVATLSPLYPAADAPPNVRVAPTSTLEDVYRTYLGAAVVVLPVTENLHASGCTVALEAQQLGVPLITSDVGGLGMYLGDERVTLYPRGDAGGVATAIVHALEARDGDVPRPGDFAERRGLTSDDYVARLVLLTRWLLDGTPDPASLECPMPVRGVLDDG